jgi:protoporphyrinogen oxidase
MASAPGLTKPQLPPAPRDSVGTAVLGAGPAGLTAAYMLALRNLRGVVYEAETAVGGIARTFRRGNHRFDLGGQAFSTDLRPIEDLWARLLGDDLLLRPRAGRRLGDGAAIVEELRYPRLGPGQMWEALRNALGAHGVPVQLDHRCVAVAHDGDRVSSLVLESGENRLESRVDGVLSSIPLGDLIACLVPSPPPAVLAAARVLRHRSLCVVALMTNQDQPFADNWICLRGADTRATRVQNFAVWGSGMVAPGTTCLGVEYDCLQDEGIWALDEADAVAFAAGELGRIGLIDPAQVFDGVKISVRHAVPIRDPECIAALPVIRSYLDGFENLRTFGRNGLHRDHTQDHSMWTAMLAAANLLEGTLHDVWDFGAEAEAVPVRMGGDQSLGRVQVVAEWPAEHAAR